MKGLYIALMDLELFPGYAEKFLGQIKAFSENGYDFEIISIHSSSAVVITSFSKDGITQRISKKYLRIPFNNRLQIYLEAFKYIVFNKCSVLYVRHILADPILILFLVCVRFFLKGVIILSEVPTFPYDQIPEYSERFIARILLRQDKILRIFLKYFYQRIVSIGYTGKIFGIKTISIGNGIDILKYKPRFISDRPDNIFRLIGVGNLKNYHGYDRLLETIKLCKVDSSVIIELHIISPFNQTLIEFQKRVCEIGLEKEIFFHGKKEGVELDDLFEKCHIAIGSLAWHRVNVDRHSNLKVREYMARGIPFIYSGVDEQIEDSFEYALKVPSNDSPIEPLLLFNLAERASSNMRSAEVMREYAEKNMNWTIAMEPVIKFLGDIDMKSREFYE